MLYTIIDYWLYIVIAYQVKWCDTPLAPCLPNIATSSLYFTCQSQSQIQFQIQFQTHIQIHIGYVEWH